PEVPADGVVLLEGELPLAVTRGEGPPKGLKYLGRILLPGEGGQGGLDEGDDGQEVVVLGAAGEHGVAAGELPLQQLNLGGERNVSRRGREPVHAGQQLAGQLETTPHLLLGPQGGVSRHACFLRVAGCLAADPLVSQRRLWSNGSRRSMTPPGWGEPVSLRQ